MRQRFGRYAIREEIGSGSTATVYRAQDGEETVALKVLHAQLSLDAVIRERFRREVLACRGLRHPGIVAVHDFLADGDESAIVMEYCPGGSLAGWRAESPADIVRAGTQIAAALAYAHERGVVHRDLKPANVLFGADGSLKLCDFGSASVQDLASVTATSAFCGDPLYVPPETALRPYPDPRGDLYALGAILYQAALGKPHAQDSLAALLDPARPGPDPAELEAFLGPRLSGVVMSLLGPIGMRPRTAADLLALLSGAGAANSESKPCLFCSQPMRLDSIICPSCLCPEPDLRPLSGSGARAIKLKKLPEDSEALKNLLRVMRAVSGDPALSPRFVTEDVRMYSIAERKRYIALPCLLMDGVAAESAEAILSLLEGRWKDKIRLELQDPDKAKRRLKKGPVLIPCARFLSGRGRDAAQTLEFEMSALRAVAPAQAQAEEEALSPYLNPADDIGIAASARRCLESAIASGSARSPLDERLLALVSRAGSALRLMRDAERGLDSVSLGELYANVKRLEAMIEDSDDAEATAQLIRTKDKASEAYDRYKETETRRAALSQALLAAASRLDALAVDAPPDARGWLSAISSLEAELDGAARGPLA